MPPPRLKFNGAQSLLEQSFRYDRHLKSFINILTVNQSFLRISQKRQIYCFVMDMRYTCIKFSLKVCGQLRSCSFELSFEKAHQIVHFLNPLIFEIKTSNSTETTKFLDLIPLVTGKVRIDHQNSTQLPIYVMQHIDEFKCDANNLNKMNIQTGMNKLEILDIYGTDQLDEALKLSPKHLKVYLRNLYVELDTSVMNSNTEKFTLNVESNFNVKTTLSNVRRILSSCPKLTEFKINCIYKCESSRSEKPVNRIVRFFEDKELHDEIISGIRQIQSNVKFCVKFKITKLFCMLPSFYTELLPKLKFYADLRNLKFSRTNKKGNKQIEMSSSCKHGRIKSKRVFKIVYDR